MLNSNIASAAYGAANRLTAGMTSAAENKASSAQNKDGVTFDELVESGVDALVGSQRKAEQVSKDMVIGKADINDVVLATQEADVDLTVATSLRDKFVSAYQDILRMAI